MPNFLTGSDPKSVLRRCDSHISHTWKYMALPASGGGKRNVLADYCLAANEAVPPLVSLFMGQTPKTAPDVKSFYLAPEKI